MTQAFSDTVSGDRGLQIEEPLIFEQDSPGALGVDWPAVEEAADRLGGLGRQVPSACRAWRSPPSCVITPGCRRRITASTPGSFRLAPAR